MNLLTLEDAVGGGGSFCISFCITFATQVQLKRCVFLLLFLLAVAHDDDDDDATSAIITVTDFA